MMARPDDVCTSRCGAGGAQIGSGMNKLHLVTRAELEMRLDRMAKLMETARVAVERGDAGDALLMFTLLEQQAAAGMRETVEASK